MDVFANRDAGAMLLKNWSDSSENYGGLVRDELSSFKRAAWTELISQNAGSPRNGGRLRILDVGTGPGFFAIIMTQAGHDVTAVDCTGAMLDAAARNAAREGLEIDFRQSDAHSLEFDDGSFDLVISRNVAWTLLDAAGAYKEWRRVLAPGGRALIFDANWNLRLFDGEMNRRYEEDQAEYRRRFGGESHPYTPEMLNFRRRMPMCSRLRPQWDIAALLEAGYQKILCDRTVWRHVWDEREKIGNRSTPMFMLVAEK
jgi:SAM-dependent methyltransferase